MKTCFLRTSRSARYRNSKSIGVSSRTGLRSGPTWITLAYEIYLKRPRSKSYPWYSPRENQDETAWVKHLRRRKLWHLMVDSDQRGFFDHAAPPSVTPMTSLPRGSGLRAS